MIPSVHTQLQWEPWALGSTLQSIAVLTIVLIFGLGGFGGWLFVCFVLFFFERSLSSGTAWLGGETDITSAISHLREKRGKWVVEFTEGGLDKVARIWGINKKYWGFIWVISIISLMSTVVRGEF